MIPWESEDKGREQRLGQRKNQKAGKDIKPSATIESHHEYLLLFIYWIAFERSGKTLKPLEVRSLKV